MHTSEKWTGKQNIPVNFRGKMSAIHLQNNTCKRYFDDVNSFQV